MWKRFPAHILLELQFYTRKGLPAGQASEPDFFLPQDNAATGNAVENAADSPCHARLFGSRAELSLGVSHAISSKKNLLLMTGSFALSILLFLSFSVLLRWVGFALNPVQSYAPDLSVAETSGQNVLDPVLVEQLEAQKQENA